MCYNRPNSAGAGHAAQRLPSERPGKRSTVPCETRSLFGQRKKPNGGAYENRSARNNNSSIRRTVAPAHPPHIETENDGDTDRSTKRQRRETPDPTIWPRIKDRGRMTSPRSVEPSEISARPTKRAVIIITTVIIAVVRTESRRYGRRGGGTHARATRLNNRR